MTNEERIKAWCECDSNNMDMYELIVADEREKMTEEQIADYLAYLSDKEKALVVLNYLLRGGITDDDLRGLRLQWIKDEREKCLKILAGKMFELQFIFNKVYEKTYQDRETLTLPEIQQRIADIADVMQRIRGESEQQDEREKIQGVDVSISWNCGIQYEHGDSKCSVDIPMAFANFLGLAQGQCKKFRIVEELP